MKLSARSILKGAIRRVGRGAVNREASIELPTNRKVVSNLPRP